MIDTPPPQTDIDKWDRWFAIECNNQAWEIADLPRRTAEQTQAMLLSAYTSRWHWSRIGQGVHYARAEMLLAWVNAVADRGADALQHADSARRLIDQPVSGVNSWDRAFMQLVEALSAQVACEHDLHRSAYLGLDAARDALDDPGDVTAFDQFAKHVNEPA
jgi:hypothetical protein